jgi:hydrogenase/urease accessory protein HupE
MTRVLVALLLLAGYQGGPAHSDELRPGYLEVRQVAPDTYQMLFKIPALGDDRRLGIYVGLPDGTTDVGAPRAGFSKGAYLERRTIRRSGGLAGQTIAIQGLSATATDVLVRVDTPDGAVQTERLTPTRTSFAVRRSPGVVDVAASYLRLGVEHILFGYDHLLFVLALVILVRQWRRVALTITAFTLAHSITLAAATLDFVSVPRPPIEAAIALSIMLVAAEIVQARRGAPSFTARRPWLVAFCFGLLHGFGFAGALAEVGLPHNAIPVALLFFNLGVELGQLVFVASVLTAGALLGRAIAPRLQPRLPANADVVSAYAIGGIAAFWLIERTSAFFA